MAKDSFFIRASTNFNGTTYAQSSIDLGAYVDALGKSVLRIHNVAVVWGEGVEAFAVLVPTANAANAFQLTTQSQSAIVAATDKSLIASGRINCNSESTVGTILSFGQTLDVAPQHFTNGYLIGVEKIYLGVNSTNADAIGLTSCSVILECTVETLSSSAAMALALSQQ